MASEILRLPCATRPGTDFIELFVHEGPNQLFAFTVKDTNTGKNGTMTVVLRPEQADEFIDFLLASRAGPLGKLAVAASKKEKT